MAQAGASLRRPAPLLVTAELPPTVFAWADGLRRAHYPAERLRLAAHVTLFHGLPPSADGEVRRALADLARAPPPAARIDGIMDLGRGTALAIASRALVDLHAELAERLHGVIQQRDDRPLRLHVTIQDKVSRAAALALQAALAVADRPGDFQFRGLAVHLWQDELWRFSQLYAFRGQR